MVSRLLTAVPGKPLWGHGWEMWTADISALI